MYNSKGGNFSQFRKLTVLNCNVARLISTFGIFFYVFSPLDVPSCHVSRFDDQLADDSGGAVFTLVSITVPDKKMQSNTYQFCVSGVW